jgi:cyclase
MLTTTISGGTRFFRQMWRPYYEVLAESHLKIETRLPNLFVAGQMNLDGPKRKAQLIARGAGHTESDMILYLPDDQIVFTSDLVFNQMHPYMGQSNPDEWIDYLNYMETLDLTTVITGHGTVCGREGISTIKTYIRTVDQLVQQMIEDNLSIKNVVEIPIPETFENWLLEEFHISNLRFMYNRQTG